MPLSKLSAGIFNAGSYELCELSIIQWPKDNLCTLEVHAKLAGTGPPHLANFDTIELEWHLSGSPQNTISINRPFSFHCIPYLIFVLRH